MEFNLNEMTALVKAALAQSSDEIAKNFVQPSTATTGLQVYNLEAPSKKLYPVLTPIRNRLPRQGGMGAIQANWKAITGINSANVRAGIAEGKRGGRISHTLAEYLAAFRGIGLEKSVTFEADYASRGFEDVRALAQLQSLQALMLAEEAILLGGNGSQAMGTTPTPSLATAAGTSSLTTQTYSVICVALSHQAYWDLAGWNNGAINQQFDATTATINASITRTNADGTTDTFGGGVAQKSANATLAVTAGQNLRASVTPVRQAFGYAWFLGTAGAERLHSITSINSIEFVANANGGAQLASALPAADNSTSALEFDGFLTICSNSSMNAYYRALATGTPGVGTGLTTDGAGGIAEFAEAFQSFYTRYRLSPQTIMMNAVDYRKMCKIIFGTGGGQPTIQVVMDPTTPTAMMAGRRVASVLNQITGQVVNVEIHPNMPQGTILFYSDQVPAYVDGVPNTARVLTRQDYYSIEWPLRTRLYEYGVYADEVLQVYTPFAFGVLTNVGG